nr:LOG family protein [Oceanococcus sp. HetDA_MAG_MS8]
MTKAYKSPEFIDSPDARPLRILAEYMEPEKRLRENHIHRAITFWGSARIQPGAKQVADGRDYYQLASDLAQKLAHWTHHNHPAGERFHVLTGAGGGIMEAAHAGAAQVDKRLNVGLNISLPFEQKPNPFVPQDQLFEFHYFFTRKYWFLNLSAALVVFPGGFGTLDELFEVLTLIQTRKAQPRPVLLFGREFWDELLALPALLRQELIAPSDLDGVLRADNVEDAFTALTAELAQSTFWAPPVPAPKE